MGNTLMGVHNGVAFVMELGYDNEYGDYEVEIVLGYHGYDFERDIFSYRRMVKKAKEKPY